jgi:hypothetical protein
MARDAPRWQLLTRPRARQPFAKATAAAITAAVTCSSIHWEE